jgi:hypothetical protein
MLKRHSDKLWVRLDELYANGTTHISTGELYHWWDIQRLSKTPWRDIKDVWTQLLDEHDEEYIDPQVHEDEGGILFFFSRNPSSLSDRAD